MRVAVLSLAAALVISNAAAENAAERYHAMLMLGGYLIRAGGACGGSGAKTTIDKGLNFASAGDLVQFNRAFPKQSEAWMLEGAGRFNRYVASKGMTASCAEAYKTAREAP